MAIVLDDLEASDSRAKSNPDELRIDKVLMGYLANRFEIALVGVKLQQGLERKRRQLEQDKRVWLRKKYLYLNLTPPLRPPTPSGGLFVYSSIMPNPLCHSRAGGLPALESIPPSGAEPPLGRSPARRGIRKRKQAKTFFIFVWIPDVGAFPSGSETLPTRG